MSINLKLFFPDSFLPGFTHRERSHSISACMLWDLANQMLQVSSFYSPAAFLCISCIFGHCSCTEVTGTHHSGADGALPVPGWALMTPWFSCIHFKQFIPFPPTSPAVEASAEVVIICNTHTFLFPNDFSIHYSFHIFQNLTSNQKKKKNCFSL